MTAVKSWAQTPAGFTRRVSPLTRVLVDCWEPLSFGTRLQLGWGVNSNTPNTVHTVDRSMFAGLKTVLVAISAIGTCCVLSHNVCVVFLLRSVAFCLATLRSLVDDVLGFRRRRSPHVVVSLLDAGTCLVKSQLRSFHETALSPVNFTNSTNHRGNSTSRGPLCSV